jgi:hypothetical protein
MGNATLVRPGGEADVPQVDRVADDARLAELVSALSGCSMHTALDLVQDEPSEDPLTTLARSLCAVLPQRRTRAAADPKVAA